jgi:homoaconitase/3-isopropylmalate dehydratase large subunit
MAIDMIDKLRIINYTASTPVVLLDEQHVSFKSMWRLATTLRTHVASGRLKSLVMILLDHASPFSNPDSTESQRQLMRIWENSCDRRPVLELCNIRHEILGHEEHFMNKGWVIVCQI